MPSEQTRTDTPGPTQPTPWPLPPCPPPPAHRRSNRDLCFRLRALENSATAEASPCPPVAHSSCRRRARRWVESMLEVKTMTAVAPAAVLAVPALSSSFPPRISSSSSARRTRGFCSARHETYRSSSLSGRVYTSPGAPLVAASSPSASPSRPLVPSPLSSARARVNARASYVRGLTNPSDASFLGSLVRVAEKRSFLGEGRPIEATESIRNAAAAAPRSATGTMVQGNEDDRTGSDAAAAKMTRLIQL
mmetsp:Transcript_57153/g.170374  ORF Transcript_57153/g.170374 Transcript_57153/m.170374 type:complete len:249 (+) Transcript_57153:611-1357(+)